MAQLTYYVAPWDRETEPAEPEWSPAPDDVHTLRHGYNLADVHRLTKMSIWRIWGLHLDYQTRYDMAWSGIVDLLYASDEPPTPGDLVFAGQDAIGIHVRDDMRHRGRGKHKDGDTMRGFAAYWEMSARHAPNPEHGVVDRLALWQIWPELTDAQRKALLALAALGTYQGAAASLGIAEKTFKQHVGNARRRFLELWHEGEEASRVWGADRRVYRRGGARVEPSYRKAAKGIRQGRTPRASTKKTELVHGVLVTYNNHKCRCALCVEAKREESTARRRRAGMSERRQITEGQFADAVRRNQAGETWTAIAASLGFSQGYLRAVRRGSAKPIADGPGIGKTSHEVNYDIQRSLSGRNTTDAPAEGMALQAVSDV